MGFSSPKAVKPTPAPPPVRETAEDVEATKDALRKKQALRQGYASTLVASAQAQGAEVKKTLLGG